MLTRVKAGELVLTLTARTGKNAGFDTGQPGLWTGPEFDRFGKHLIPTLSADGRRVLATVGCATAGELPHCEGEGILIDLEEIPEESGRRESKILWSGTANLSIQRTSCTI
jgi:hypothetical protein